VIDPINTTEQDGTACRTCGESADREALILGIAHPIPLCGSCEADLTCACSQCARVIWQAEGRRIFGADLMCADCAKPWLTAASTKELIRDEQRDAFNERRR
jgi:hypothetical protein